MKAIHSIFKCQKTVFILLVLIINGSLSQSAYSQWRLSLDFLPGAAVTAPSFLGIYQEGEPDLEFTARYQVKPFELPLYYSYRLGLWKNNKGFEIEMNHLKIYLKNNPAEVELFSISHGYNQVWFNYAVKHPYFTWRLGIGPVITHHENMIRGLRWPETGGLFNDGYYFRGISAQAAIQKKLYLTKFMYLSAEAKLNGAYARVEVVSGHAKVPVFAAHLLAGVGFDINFR